MADEEKEKDQDAGATNFAGAGASPQDFVNVHGIVAALDKASKTISDRGNDDVKDDHDSWAEVSAAIQQAKALLKDSEISGFVQRRVTEKAGQPFASHGLEEKGVLQSDRGSLPGGGNPTGQGALGSNPAAAKVQQVSTEPAASEYVAAVEADKATPKFSDPYKQDKDEDDDEDDKDDDKKSKL